MTHVIDAPVRVDPEHVRMIDGIGTRIDGSETSHTTLPPTVLIESALYGALSDTVGASRHSAAIEINGKPPQAQILGVGIAHADRSLPNQTPTAAFVNLRSGTLAVAAGTGSRVGVEATVRAFERRGARERIWRTNIADAKNIVADAMFRTAPKVIQATQEALQAEPDATTASGLGVQIVGDALVYTGEHPLLVFNVQTREFTWLNDKNSPTEPGAYRLDPGRHMLLMAAGPDAASRDMGIINEAFLAALKLKPTEHPETEEAAGQARAAQVASYVQEALGGSVRDVTVVAAAIRVAGDPVATAVQEPDAPTDDMPAAQPEWHDTRSRLRRATDWGRFATFATMTAAQFFDPTIRDQRRRQIYEQATRTHGIAGHVGRAAVIAADVAIGTGLGIAVARFAAPELAHLGHSIGHEIGTIGHFHSGHTTDTQAAIHQETAPVDQNHPNTPATDPQQTTHPVDTHPAAQLPDTYTALAHDPHRGGRPSTIYDTERYLIAKEAQGRLTDTQITSLQHDDKFLEGGVAAFIGDHSDPDNLRAAHSLQHQINANATYSLHDLKAYNEKVIVGIAPVPAAHTPQAAGIAPAATPPAVGRAQVVTPLTVDHASPIKKIALGGAEGAAIATGGAVGGWLIAKKLFPWLRKRRSTATESQPVQLVEGTRAATATQTNKTSISAKAAPLTPSSPRHRSTGLASSSSADSTDPTDPNLGLTAHLIEPVEPPAPVGPFEPNRVDRTPADVTASYRSIAEHDEPDPMDIHFKNFYDGVSRLEEKPLHGKGKRYRELLKSGENVSLGTFHVTKKWVKAHPLTNDKPGLFARIGSIFSPKRSQPAEQPKPSAALERRNGADTTAETPEPKLAGAAA